jgi:hypothetical protein
MLVTSSEIWAKGSSALGPSQVFDLNGRYLRTHTGTPPFAVFTDGSILVVKPTLFRPPSTVGPGRTFTDSVDLQRVHGNDTITIARLPSERLVTYDLEVRFAGRATITAFNGAPQVFGPKAALFVRHDLIYFGLTDAYEIAVLNTLGGTVRTIARSVPRVRVTATERAAFLSHVPRQETPLSAWREEYNRVHRRAVHQNMVFPEYHRAFASILVDSEANIWIEHLPAARSFYAGNAPYPGQTPGRAPARWDVFGPAGDFLGTVDLPHGLDVQDIGPDYVIGIWRDERDVPFVRVYSLRRQSL